MNLSKIIRNIKYIDKRGDCDVEVLSLSQNAQKKCDRGLLFCYKGVKYDTHDYYQIFKDNGYVALVVERFLDIDLPQILVKNTRKVMNKMCNTFFLGVKDKLHFIGVTGTNGKTTTTSIIYQILSNAGEKVALIGTSGVFYADKALPPLLTTPDPVDLFYLLDDFYKNGIKYVVMEVSAHALSLDKLRGIKFEISLFTNITQDHLDYFSNMGNYSRAKLKLFSPLYSKYAIINTDDRYGYMFSHIVSIPFTTYGITSPAENFAMDISCDLSSTSFLAHCDDKIFDITTPLICKFNVYNILGAMTACLKLNVDSDVVFKTVKNLKSIAGRMNVYRLSRGGMAVIDYAHTPDGLEQVLSNLRCLTDGNIYTLFGCGGDRDRLKRAKMGKIASILSSHVFVTSDNPRYEEPEDIMENIIDGIEGDNFTAIVDRKECILRALNSINSGDVLLIAGKGAENYIDIKGKRLPYSDLDVLEPFIVK